MNRVSISADAWVVWLFAVLWAAHTFTAARLAYWKRKLYEAKYGEDD